MINKKRNQEVLKKNTTVISQLMSSVHIRSPEHHEANIEISTGITELASGMNHQSDTIKDIRASLLQVREMVDKYAALSQKLLITTNQT